MSDRWLPLIFFCIKVHVPLCYFYHVDSLLPQTVALATALVCSIIFADILPCESEEVSSDSVMEHRSLYGSEVVKVRGGEGGLYSIQLEGWISIANTSPTHPRHHSDTRTKHCLLPSADLVYLYSANPHLCRTEQVHIGQNGTAVGPTHISINNCW